MTKKYMIKRSFSDGWNVIDRDSRLIIKGYPSYQRREALAHASQLESGEKTVDLDKLHEYYEAYGVGTHKGERVMAKKKRKRSKRRAKHSKHIPLHILKRRHTRLGAIIRKRGG